MGERIGLGYGEVGALDGEADRLLVILEASGSIIFAGEVETDFSGNFPRITPLYSGQSFLSFLIFSSTSSSSLTLFKEETLGGSISSEGHPCIRFATVMPL